MAAPPAEARDRTAGLRAALAALARRKRLVTGLQVGGLVVLLAFLTYALRDAAREAAPLLRHADPVDIALGVLLIGAYYLAFVVGWRYILRAYGERLSY